MQSTTEIDDSKVSPPPQRKEPKPMNHLNQHDSNIPILNLAREKSFREHIRSKLSPHDRIDRNDILNNNNNNTSNNNNNISYNNNNINSNSREWVSIPTYGKKENETGGMVTTFLFGVFFVFDFDL